VSLTATASDPDGADVVSLSAFGYPAGLAFSTSSGNPASATVSGILGAGSSAGSPYRIRWCANSGDLVGTTSQLVVQVSSDLPPVVTAPASVTRTERSFIEIQISAADPDGQPISALTADFSSLPAGNNAVFTTGAANTSGVMTWTPGVGHTGDYPVRFTATNALSGRDTTLIHVTPVTTGAESGDAPARVLILEQNRPNPFNPMTTIRYRVPGEGPVTLRVYDAQARLVKTLARAWLPPGDYEASWDGRDESGSPSSSGVYTLRLEAAGAALSRRMVLLR
jgi:flagellar hook capping protein FlgD/Big-like domain-containing protein